MRRDAFVSLSLWALAQYAHAQEPLPFDYRCDAAAATTPAGLPSDGWQRASDRAADGHRPASAAQRQAVNRHRRMCRQSHAVEALVEALTQVARGASFEHLADIAIMYKLATIEDGCNDHCHLR